MMQRFASDSVTYGTTTILSRSTQLIALLVLPFILSPRDYGALGMIITLIALAVILVPLEIAQSLARFYVPAAPAAKKALGGTAWTFLLLMVAAFIVAGQLLAPLLCRLVLGDLSYLLIFRLALLLMALNCLFAFLQAQCRWDFRTAEYVLISLVFSFFSLALSLGLALIVEPALLGVVIGQLLGAGIAVALGAVGLHRRLPIRLDRDRLAEMLRFSLPLVPATLALSVCVHASRLILNGLSDLEEVGLYTLAGQLAGIAALGIVGVQGALTPLVVAHHEEPETPLHLARLFEGFIGSAIVVSLLIGLFAPELIYFVGNPDYGRAGPLVLLLAPGLLLTQMYVFAPGFTLAKKTVQQMWVSLASALFAVISSFVLIKMWGMIGAAAATLATGLFFIALWFAFSQRLYPVPVRWLSVAVAAFGGAGLGWIGMVAPYSSVGAALLLKALVVSASAALVVMLGLVPMRAIFVTLRALPASFAGRRRRAG